MPVSYEIAIVVGLIMLNGFFALAEIALVSARKGRLHEMAEAGNRGAAVALTLSESPERFLSTVQVGITLIGVLAGAFGGATLAEDVAALLVQVELFAPYAELMAIVLVVLAISYLSLVIGELVPKRIALAYPEFLASVLAPMMRGFATVTSPVVALLSASTLGVMFVLRITPPADSPVSAEEVRILVRQGRDAGVFEKAEHDLVERVFRLGDRRVSSLMTPRTEIVWIDADQPIGDAMRRMIHSGHTSFPVCRGDIEHVLGMTSVKEQLSRMVNRQAPDLHVNLEPPLYVPENAAAFKVLETFRESGKHKALVVDEYGGLSGLITLNDILEAVIGEMAAARQTEHQPVVRRDDGSWLIDAWLPISEVVSLLEIKLDPDEARRKYDTLAGMILDELGEIPRVASRVTWYDFEFEVVDMDGRRIDKVLVRRVPEPAEPAPEAT